MQIVQYGKEIKESKSTLLQLRDQQKSALYYRRLHFLYVLKSGSCQSQAEAGAQIGIKLRAAQKLWNRYKQQGLAGLLGVPCLGRPAKLTEPCKAALNKELQNDSMQTLKQACHFVAQHSGVSISEAAMHYYFKRAGIKKKTGRPTSVRKDAAGEKHFKKSLS